MSMPLDIVKRWLPRRQQIGLVEILGVVAAFTTWQTQLSNSDFLVFIDNNQALCSLVKGYSSAVDAAELVGLLWILEVLLAAPPTLQTGSG